MFCFVVWRLIIKKKIEALDYGLKLSHAKSSFYNLKQKIHGQRYTLWCFKKMTTLESTVMAD